MFIWKYSYIHRGKTYRARLITAADTFIRNTGRNNLDNTFVYWIGPPLAYSNNTFVPDFQHQGECLIQRSNSFQLNQILTFLQNYQIIVVSGLQYTSFAFRRVT